MEEEKQWVKVRFDELNQLIRQIFEKLGVGQEDSRVIAEIYVEMTKRGVGHHDIYNLPSRIEGLKSGKLNPDPTFEKLAGFGGMESWDGDNGLGEIVNHFSMERAVSLAREHGIGLCTVRNSNHYLCSAPYVMQAAKAGYIGFIIAKGVPSMGVPGIKGKIVGQSPIGYAFPVKGEDPVMLDICLAYASGEQLKQRAEEECPVPTWWGIDSQGNPAENAKELLKGTKYPIGEHKGFGLAVLCELLTGVLSSGLILDQDEKKEGIAEKSTSHTAIAIKADAFMSRQEYEERSQELIDRLRARAEGVHIPGDSSWKNKRELEEKGKIELKKELVEKLNKYAAELGTVPLQ